MLNHEDEIWFGSKCRVTYDAHGGGAATTPDDSTLSDDLAKIREELDRVGNSMTLMGKAGAVATAEQTISGPSQEELVTMGRAYRRLEALYKASNQATRLIASNAGLDERLGAVLDCAIEVTDAQRGFVLLRDPESGELSVHVAREMGGEVSASSPSMGIAYRAAELGEPVIMRDRDKDSKFGMRESIIVQKIHSAMCAPLKVEDRLLGSIYVDTRNPVRVFEETDLELFASMAAQSSLAIENAQLAEKMIEEEKKRANLGRFLSPSVVEAIMNEKEDLVLGGRKQEVTTMFCDIRSFTPIAEQMPPAELVDLLNHHFTAMVGIVFHYKGTLDKYIGDELMAVFGAPILAHDDAERALRAALEMQRRNTELNAEREAEGRPRLELGIGISSGEVIAGYVGAPERMEFTVVGDRVNVGKRLCSYAEGGQVVISDLTYERVKDLVEAEAIGEVELKGKAVPVAAYRITKLK
jgi:adenylate cyclase